MSEALAGLHAVWLLARGRRDGVARLAPPPEQALALARRSFWALPLAMAPLICLHLIAWGEAGVGPAPWRDLLGDAAGVALGWLAFAVLSHRFAGQMGRAAHWPLFITVWNWCNLLQYLVLVAAALPALFGLPAFVAETAWLVVIGWALWLEWFATSITLAVPALPAASFVLLDVLIGLVVVLASG